MGSNGRWWWIGFRLERHLHANAVSCTGRMRRRKDMLWALLADIRSVDVAHDEALGEMRRQAAAHDGETRTRQRDLTCSMSGDW
jgi:hypothetical protein